MSREDKQQVVCLGMRGRASDKVELSRDIQSSLSHPAPLGLCDTSQPGLQSPDNYKFKHSIIAIVPRSDSPYFSGPESLTIIESQHFIINAESAEKTGGLIASTLGPHCCCPSSHPESKNMRGQVRVLHCPEYNRLMIRYREIMDNLRNLATQFSYSNTTRFSFLIKSILIISPGDVLQSDSILILISKLIASQRKQEEMDGPGSEQCGG